MKNKNRKYTQINTTKSRLCTVKCNQCTTKPNPASKNIYGRSNKCINSNNSFATSTRFKCQRGYGSTSVYNTILPR